MGAFWSWLLSLKPEEWTAIGTIILALLTILIVVVGWIQLRSIRKEAETARTLVMCDRYNYDPVLDMSARTLSVALATGGDFRTNPGKYKCDVVTILNY